MILLAFALWNGGGGLRVAELVSVDPERLGMIGALFQALSDGPDAIDAWLEAAESAQPETAGLNG